jgi:membrane protein implicated in regulation of membrane protease activity
MGLLCIAIGYERVLDAQEGGGTLVVGGLVILLVDFAIVVGLASTRVKRVEKAYHRIPALVGEEGMVKERIPAEGRGVVLVRNELWTATSSSELPPGSRIKIVKTDGVLLYVEGERP